MDLVCTPSAIIQATGSTIRKMSYNGYKLWGSEGHPMRGTGQLGPIITWLLSTAYLARNRPRCQISFSGRTLSPSVGQCSASHKWRMGLRGKPTVRQALGRHESLCTMYTYTARDGLGDGACHGTDVLTFKRADCTRLGGSNLDGHGCWLDIKVLSLRITDIRRSSLDSTLWNAPTSVYLGCLQNDSRRPNECNNTNVAHLSPKANGEIQ